MTGPSHPPTARLFVGVFPPPRVVEALSQALVGLPNAGPGWALQPPEQWHVTVWFLGATPLERVPDLQKTLRAWAPHMEGFRATLTGSGWFPKDGPRKVLWAGVEDPEAGWGALAESLRRPLSDLGFELEGRGFHPHLTLARARDPWAGNALSASLHELLLGFRAGWDVDSVQLIESTLGLKASYGVLENYRFGKA